MTSFTKAAAQELASRGLDVNRDIVGTLHSICYRALERPTIAETKSSEFNRVFPQFALSRDGEVDGSVDVDDPYGSADLSMNGDLPGAQLMARMQLLRARMVDQAIWPEQVRLFNEAWSAWKRANGYLDFTDLIERCFEDVEVAPYNPMFAICDEAQDLVNVQLALVRKWAKHMQYAMIVSDANQCIYSFLGASPDALLTDDIPETNKHVLEQSYRVPRAVHAYATEWIKQASVREDAAYYPRDYEGEVKRSTAQWAKPETALQEIRPYLDEGKTVMVLASCSYMLDPLIKLLKESGTPFSNYWRRKQGRWNPLHASRGVSASQRILSLLRPDPRVWDTDARMWTHEELRQWAEVLNARGGIFARAGKALLETYKGNGEVVSVEQLTDVFSEQVVDDLIFNSDLIEWFEKNLMASKRHSFEFPLLVAKTHGAKALKDEPLLTVGTCHCSPPDELVLTNHGQVAMEDLNPTVHRILSYNDNDNRVAWSWADALNVRKRHQHYANFIVAKNPYRGRMLTITTAASKTRVTPNHVIRTRYADAFYNKWCLYLMRRGDWWRVGICTSAHRPYRSGGVMGRLYTEQADDGWILGLYETRKDAMMAEAIVHGKYGMPSATFEVSSSRQTTREDMRYIHEATKEYVSERVEQLLSDYGLLAEYPLYVRRKGSERRGMSGYAFDTAASNFMPGYMMIPTIRDDAKSQVDSPVWMDAELIEEYYDGDVYSLDVPPFHYYISGGAVVHNSVKGGQCSTTLLFPDLSRSGMQEYLSMGEARDAVIRTFYVGATRCSQSLILASPSSPFAVRL